MTPTDTQVGDRWFDLERLAKAATPGPWAWEDCDLLNPTIREDHKRVIKDEPYEGQWLDPDGADGAFIAAANPATVLELIAAARAVGTSNASEPEQKPHPIRGDGEPVWAIGSWLSAALDDPKVCAEMKRDINEWFDEGGYRRAHPPTTYGKGEREAVALDWLAANRNCELDFSYGDEDDDGCWRVHRVNGGRNDREWTLIGQGATPTDAILQALQSISGRTE